jgi:hypothetical protein
MQFVLKFLRQNFLQIVKLFASDLDATQISQIVNLNRTTINRYLIAIREQSAEFCRVAAKITKQSYSNKNYVTENAV